MPVPDSGISRAKWWTPPATSSPFRGAASSATTWTARSLGRAGPGYFYSAGTEVAMAPCDVYDVYVVRKQLYISDEHERALKARARELGVSEAELVRRMLDGLLLDGEGGRGLAGAGAAEALEGFLKEADRLAESHRFQRGYVFDRNELYEDRV